MLQILNGISNASGLNLKKTILSDAVARYPIIKQIISYTYDPFKQYHIKQFPKISGEGPDIVSEVTFDLLDQFNDRELTGYDLQRAYFNHAKNLTRDNQELFQRILKRDLRIGLNTASFNSLWPRLIPLFEVMLAHKVDWDRITYPCYASPKLDGVRAIFMQGEFYTRSGKIILGLDHIKEQLNSCVDDLDGELVVRGTNFQTGCGNIRSHGDSPEALFCMFENISIKDPFRWRLESLKQYREDNTLIVKHDIIKDENEARKYYARCRSKGFEGSVIKPLDYRYEKKRSYSWMKLKAIETEDLTCVGFYLGTGKYKHILGGIIVDRYGVEVRVGGGFSDDERLHIWMNKPIFLNVKAEITYQEVTPDGSLRHPRFTRWRQDKS